MEIAVDKKNDCRDGLAGQITCLFIEPQRLRLTHLVVAERHYPYLKRLVPVQLLTEIRADRPSLNCTLSQLAILRPFLEVEYPRSEAPYFAYEAHLGQLWPYETTETMPVPLKLATLPAQIVSLHRDASVRASDGQAGQMAGFSIRLPDGVITHSLVRRGWLWCKKVVRIPAAVIDRIEKEVVYLKLDKDRLSRNCLPVSTSKQRINTAYKLLSKLI